MRITVFNSSPRGARGNTHVIVTELAKGAQEAGAEFENVFLVDKTIGHCRGCFVCWFNTPGQCVIKDDMAELLDKMRASDIVGFATPLYVDNVSGIMKQFMDRVIPLVDPHFAKDPGNECKHPFRSGKPPKFLVIANSGFPEQSHFQVLRLLFQRIARNCSTELAGEIYRGAGELLRNDSLLLGAFTARYKKALRKAGKELAETGRLSEKTMAQLEKPLVPESQYIKGANKHFDTRLRKLDK